MMNMGRNIKLRDSVCSILTFSLILSLFPLISCNKTPRAGDKMKSNPNAIYHGGTDGGYYFEVLEAKNDRFRVRIFLDYNETLILDAYFASKNDSCNLYLTQDNIQNSISTYNDKKIFIKVPSMDEYCKLEIVETFYDKFEE